MHSRFVDLAVPGPFKAGLQYILPAEIALSDEQLIGCRAWVPISTRKVVGVITGLSNQAKLPLSKMKVVLELIDEVPVCNSEVRELMKFVSDYYHVSLGDAYYTALPNILMKGRPLLGMREKSCHPRERKDRVKSLEITLNSDQTKAIQAIKAHLNTFSIHLLEGVTGSGKTEVYLELVEATLQAGKSALVLVPEIGLTPQTIKRFQARFGEKVEAYHSCLTENERRRSWRLALTGEARIIIGTRSAVFLPLQDMGLIIIDEEHDSSYKQQTGVHYSAKSVAIMRARERQCAVVLGSATPSVESLYFAKHDRYYHHRLLKQAKGGKKASIQLIDMRSHRNEGGLSKPLIDAMHQHLQAGNQVLIFLNRRGFAPILMCNDCGDRVQCPYCEMTYTLHQCPPVLMCHHCGLTVRIPKVCRACHSTKLVTVGTGTEQVEEILQAKFADQLIVRLDQDVTRKKGALEAKLLQIHNHEARIIVGTQMLSKGHDFTNITLVGIVDLDYGFFAPDFRGIERMGQLLIQVAGRAGRAHLPGNVLIQTRVPDHPLLLKLLKEGYSPFAMQLLDERAAAEWPPFQYMAIFRAEHRDEARLMEFLQGVKGMLKDLGVRTLGPVFSALRKRAGQYRAQVLLESPRRKTLHAALLSLEVWLSTQRAVPRFVIDVDPLEVI